MTVDVFRFFEVTGESMTTFFVFIVGFRWQNVHATRVEARDTHDQEVLAAPT